MMVKNCKAGFFLLVLLLSGSFLKAQTGIDTLLNTYGERFPQEKIYIQYDKNFYNAGETIWFKAYLTADNLTTTLSKTLYAELIDDKGTILQKKIMPIYESGAASNFDLPANLTSTNLYVRAYTSWMQNFDSTLLYLKSIQIVPAKNTVKKSQPKSPTTTLTFFPEGGNLVENLNCRVAFKATNENGNPANVSGNIVTDQGKQVVAFSSVHDGMGYFLINPLPGEKYKAQWKDAKGKAQETAVPASLNQGVVLTVIKTNDSINYNLQRSDNASEDFKNFTVIAQMQQQVVYMAKINLSKRNSVTAPINTDNFTDGVMQVTVFNAQKVPVAERVVFVNHNTNSFLTDLHLVEKDLTKHGHNTLQVDVGDTIFTNLSIAVTDADINPIAKNEENIFSGLLLTSDLRGYVFNPSYYFKTEGDSVKQYLDLVMMTNGWRRYNWQNILTHDWPKLRFPIDNYLSVNGTILGLNRIQLSGKDLTGIVKTKNKTGDFINIPVNDKGQFRITGMYFFDTAKLYYQINGDKDKSLTSSASFTFKNEIANPPAPKTDYLATLFTNKTADSVIVQKSSQLALQQRSLFEAEAKTLEVVEIKTRVKSLKQKMDEEYTSGFFSGGDGYTFTTEDDPFAKSAISVMDYLRGKVAGLQIAPDGSSVSWRGSNTSVFLNEITTDITQVQNINMNDVAMIKVFRPPFFGASGGGAGGAIAVYTKKGGGDNSNIKGLNSTELYGFSPIKEFYMPDYEKNNTNKPDFRSTLYWNPFLIMDRNTRRIKVPFYNTDNCKRIRVVIEGINRLGQFTREEKFFD